MNKVSSLLFPFYTWEREAWRVETTSLRQEYGEAEPTCQVFSKSMFPATHLMEGSGIVKWIHPAQPSSNAKGKTQVLEEKTYWSTQPGMRECVCVDVRARVRSVCG